MQINEGDDILKSCKRLIQVFLVSVRGYPSRKRPKNPYSSQILHDEVDSIPGLFPKKLREFTAGVDYIDLGRNGPSCREYVQMPEKQYSFHNEKGKTQEENEMVKKLLADIPMELAVEEDFL